MKKRKNKYFNKNQKSFYFEDYLETSLKKKIYLNHSFLKIGFMFYFLYFFV